MPHFAGYLRRCDGVNEGGSLFLVALDIVGPKPSGEIVRINIDPADGDAARDYGRELALNVLVPLVEGRLEAAPVLSESANAIVVLGGVPGDGNDLRRTGGHSGHSSPSFDVRLLSQRIREALKRNGRSAHSVSMAATGHEDAIRNIYRAARSGRRYAPRIDTIAAIAAELGETVEHLTCAEAVSEHAGAA